jgi:hypothetical protein
MTEQDVLWQSHANAARAGMEIDALMIALRDLLADGGLGSLRIDVESEYEMELETEQGWTVGYSLYAYKVIPARGRAGNRGWVTFGVSFWRAEDERGTGWQGAQAAKLYVAYWPSKGEGWTPDNLFVDGSGQSLDTEPYTPWRWRGAGSGTMSEAWFFCVRILDLRSRSDLDREVATPLRSLLEGHPDERAFSGSTVVLLPPAIRADRN